MGYGLDRLNYYIFSRVASIAQINLGKWNFDHFCLHQFITNFYVDIGIERSKSLSYVAHPNGLAQAWRLRAGSDHTNIHIIKIFNLIAVSGNSFFYHFKTDQLSFYAFFFLSFKYRSEER